MMRKTFIIVGILAVLVVLVVAFNTQSGPRPQVGFKAPDFTLNTLDGQTIKLSDLNGKPVLLNFWATWCPPCKEEMPALQSMYERYKDQVDIYAINLTAQDATSRIQPYLQELGLTFPVLLDETGEVGDLYQTHYIPVTVMIDKNGLIVERITGGASEAQFAAMFDKVLQNAR